MNKRLGLLLVLGLLVYAPQAKPIWGYFEGKKEFRVDIGLAGVGGAGGNIISHLINSSDFPKGVKIGVFNTDVPDLVKFKRQDKAGRVPSENIIQIGVKKTQGLGAGAKPDNGKLSAEESMPEIDKFLKDLKVVFLVAGLGGGTGSGAIGVIAKRAQELGILVISEVLLPFESEGSVRNRNTNIALEAILKYSHSVIVAKNQTLFDNLKRSKAERALLEKPGFKTLNAGNRGPSISESYAFANDVLAKSIKTLGGIIQETGVEHIDFADICAIMKDIGGLTIMGSGRASGDDRAIKAVKEAVLSSLFPELTIDGARGVIVYLRGCDIGMDEKEAILNFVKSKVGRDANIINGLASPDQALQDELVVEIIATGLEPKVLRAEMSKKMTTGAPASLAEDARMKAEEEQDIAELA